MTPNVPQVETENSETGRDDDAAARWTTPDFQVVETSMEVTAYFGAEL